jgi:hypothetical protein
MITARRPEIERCVLAMTEAIHIYKKRVRN